MAPKIHPVVAELLAEIEAYRARSGVDRTAFGLEAVQDGNFISRLEHGRNPRLQTIDRVRIFIARKTKAVR
jgi:hypothetical protein